MIGKLRKSVLTRRSMFRGAAAAAMLGPLFKATEGSVSAQERVNRNSSPSTLKITDIRACRVAANYDYPLIRVDTNQGVYGLGEVRDAGVEGIALILKPFLVGRNPLQIESILDSVRQFAGHGRMGGGYSAVDMALHDLAGKAYGVPAYRLIGTRNRDRIRIYADTTSHPDPKVYAERMRKRKEMGLTFFKMDLESIMLKDRPGALDERGVCTQKGLGYLCEYIAAIRDVIGQGTPLAADHFGPLNLNDSIRYAKAFEPYGLAWAEDLLQVPEGHQYPYLNWQAYKTISEATVTPVLTGEDIFGLQGGFQALLDNRALDAIHPDIETSGGLLETKQIADCAERCGIRVAMHHAGSPIGGYAGYHCAATFGNNFLAMENHALDMPWWQDLVTGVSKPIIEKGYVAVPDRPGLGLELNDGVVKEHLRRPGYFEPTPMFDDLIVSGFHTGGPWPHYDETGKWCNCVSYE
ncbi:MAG TPA: mandelate racemase/muconate lactonizing enzyme family protein [Bryobacteraceae bacterium]|nr:mandelate racemase/muconate lactonizing enzyme family protein [Bryobacteraceae bacterium]